MIFKTAGDLADQLLDWFRGYPRENEAHRQHFRHQLKRFQKQRWDDEWTKIAKPILCSVDS